MLECSIEYNILNAKINSFYLSTCITSVFHSYPTSRIRLKPSPRYTKRNLDISHAISSFPALQNTQQNLLNRFITNPPGPLANRASSNEEIILPAV